MTDIRRLMPSGPTLTDDQFITINEAVVEMVKTMIGQHDEAAVADVLSAILRVIEMAQAKRCAH